MPALDFFKSIACGPTVIYMHPLNALLALSSLPGATGFVISSNAYTATTTTPRRCRRVAETAAVPNMSSYPDYVPRDIKDIEEPVSVVTIDPCRLGFGCRSEGLYSRWTSLHFKESISTKYPRTQSLHLRELLTALAIKHGYACRVRASPLCPSTIVETRDSRRTSHLLAMARLQMQYHIHEDSFLEII